MEYLQPQTTQEALKDLRKWEGKGLLIAGGTNVLPDLRAKKLYPEALVDISRLKGLSFIKKSRGRIRLGPLTTIAEIAASENLKKVVPILCEAASHLGNPLVRNRATLGGNLSHASPAADMAVPLLSLEAVVVAESDGFRRREIQLDKFFLGPNQTALLAGEMIREIYFPEPAAGTRTAYQKIGLRNAMAISVVSLAVSLRMKKGICEEARIGLGAVAPRPIRAYETEKILAGKKLAEMDLELLGKRIEKEVSPIGDIRASEAYRKRIASVLLQKTLGEILEMET